MKSCKMYSQGRFCVWGDPWYDSNGHYDGHAGFGSEITCPKQLFCVLGEPQLYTKWPCKQVDAKNVI